MRASEKSKDESYARYARYARLRAMPRARCDDDVTRCAAACYVERDGHCRHRRDAREARRSDDNMRVYADMFRVICDDSEIKIDIA